VPLLKWCLTAGKHEERSLAEKAKCSPRAVAETYANNKIRKVRTHALIIIRIYKYSIERKRKNKITI